MTTDRAVRWPSLTVLAGSAAVIALMVVAAVRYPGTVDSKGAAVFLAVAGVLVAVYLVVAVRGLRRPGDGRGVGAWIGVAAAVSWSIEIWAGGPAKLSYANEQLVGGTFALLAVVLTVAAGPVVALTRRVPGAGVRAGVFAGLTSGVLLFLVANVMTLSTLPILASRADYQHQFAVSGDPNINTFLVGDMLAGTVSHLAINLVLGLIGAGLTALISRAGARGRTSQEVSAASV